MARELLDERKYEDAAQAARKAVEMAQSCLAESGDRQRSEALESARRVVEEVKQLGVLVAEAEALLEKAVQAMRSAEHELSDRLAREAQEKARAAGDGFNQASEVMTKLDADFREVQGKKPDLDYRDVTTPWTEASAAWDRGDYAAAAELARKAVARLEDFKKEQAAQKAAAPGPPPQKYRCPSCAKVFQVVPPAFRPFDVGCPHCHTVVRISK
jgi:tetratricopeptide (TPR) repeat protein